MNNNNNNNKTCGDCKWFVLDGSGFCRSNEGTECRGNDACSFFDPKVITNSERNGICPECGSYLFSYEHTEDNDWQLCTCDCCGCSGTPDEFLYNSVFARITTSPEVLAETLVIPDEDHNGWYSVIIPTDYGQYFKWFSTKEAAHAATVAKLKESKR